MSGTRKRRRKRSKKKKGLQKFLSMPHGKLICALVLVIVIVLGVVTVRAVTVDRSFRHITMEDLQSCHNKKDYLDKVLPIYKTYCREFHIKYPEILALQVFYEVGSGFPQQLSAVAIADNNLGGLKYTEGIPRATKGEPCPANEGGYYCHFKNVSDYIYAQCWQIGQPLYDNVRKHQSSVTEFTRSLCNLWIGGVEGDAPFGYSEALIADYELYHTDD